jgi:hypothetical protein
LRQKGPNEKTKMQRPAHGEINQLNGPKETEKATRSKEKAKQGTKNRKSNKTKEKGLNKGLKIYGEIE